MYEPVKRVYRDQDDYLNIMVPLLKLEWLRHSEGYQVASLRAGMITGAVNLQVHDNGPEQLPTAMVALTLSIPFQENCNFWDESNPACIREVNLTIERRQVRLNCYCANNTSKF